MLISVLECFVMLHWENVMQMLTCQWTLRIFHEHFMKITQKKALWMYKYSAQNIPEWRVEIVLTKDLKHSLCINVLKFSSAVSCVNVELKTNISESSQVSISRANVANIYSVTVCRNVSSYWCTMQQEDRVKFSGHPSHSYLSPCHLTWCPCFSVFYFLSVLWVSVQLILTSSLKAEHKFLCIFSGCLSLPPKPFGKTLWRPCQIC